MKKSYILFVALLVLSLAGCSTNNAQPNTSITVLGASAQNVFLSSGESSKQEEASSIEPLESSAMESKNTVSSRPETAPSYPPAESSKPPVSSAPPQSTSTPASPPSSAAQKATVSDAKAISNKIIEYINQYRVAQGSGAAVKLPGLTQVAEYRSRQLVTNYAHDTNDTREATRFYQYGNHVVYEDDVVSLDYYDHCAREAIGRSGGNYSIDEVANIMASGFKNSAAHWDYVGSGTYKYIAVGATYGNGQWYVCILMSKENTYG